MIEARVHYIDVKNSFNKAYASVSFEDVTFSTGTDELGNTYEYVSNSINLCDRDYEFPQPIEEATILEFIESERSKL